MANLKRTFDTSENSFKATLVLLNGNIHTLNPKQPRAQALAIHDDKIVHVGDNQEVKKYVGSKTKLIDLAGKTVLPGFIDTHVHILSFGRNLTAINLRNADSIKQIQQAIRKKAKETPQGKWIIGHGWDQEKLKERRLPTREDLDKATKEHPVIIIRVCYHLCVANSKALRKAGIDKKTLSPQGGKIEKDPETGQLTGVLRENAQELVFKAIPKPTEDELLEACLLACQKAVENGLTTIHWIIENPREIRVIQRLRAEGKRLPRVYLLIPERYLDTLTELGLQTGFGDLKVKIGAIKILADGSLGARTAALQEPYSDDPNTCGMLLYPQKELEKIVVKAHKFGFQLAIHAIGDKAVEVVLDAIEKALEENPVKEHRHRIEHASMLNKRLIERMKKLKTVVTVQPHFVVSDFWVVDRVGSTRARWVYPYKSLLKENLVVTGGSDCPIEPINPLLGVWAAVTMHPYKEQRLSVEEALHLYTVNAAFSSFEENLKGSIENGKLADLVVLSDDPFTVEAEKIKDISVLMTIIGGQIAFNGKP